MEVIRYMLILRLFSAFFLALIGVLLMCTNNVNTERILGVVLAAMGLTGLGMVWLGTKTR